MKRNSWKLEIYLKQLIGRKVKKVFCCKAGSGIDSPAQFIMEMDNDSTYELYGRENLGISGLRHNTSGFCEGFFSAAAGLGQAGDLAGGKK